MGTVVDNRSSLQETRPSVHLQLLGHYPYCVIDDELECPVTFTTVSKSISSDVRGCPEDVLRRVHRHRRTFGGFPRGNIMNGGTLFIPV